MACGGGSGSSSSGGSGGGSGASLSLVVVVILLHIACPPRWLCPSAALSAGHHLPAFNTQWLVDVCACCPRPSLSSPAFPAIVNSCVASRRPPAHLVALVSPAAGSLRCSLVLQGIVVAAIAGSLSSLTPRSHHRGRWRGPVGGRKALAEDIQLVCQR